LKIANYYRHEQYVLDASSVINLYGSGYMSDILRCTRVRFAVSKFVKEREALTVLEAPDNNGHQECIPIVLDNMVSAGLLKEINNDSLAVASNVIILGNFGIRGMGEIISAALAMENGWGIVLDDKGATAKLESLLPQIQMLTTFDVVKLWAQHHSVGNAILREVLCNIRIRGNFHIANDHPLFTWVISHGG